MHASDTATTRQPRAGQSATRRRPRLYGKAKVTNDPLSRTNGNTPEGKRTRDLYRCFMAEAGNPDSDTFRAAALAAAELTVVAEQARSAVLKSGNIADLDQVVRVQGSADRALQRLGLKQHAAAKPAPGQALADHLARMVRERPAVPNDDDEQP
jgi:hypothetical protein